MPATRRHAVLNQPLGAASLCPPGKPRAAGIVKTPHHAALSPTASMRERVLPPPRPTGIARSASIATPLKKPMATPVDERRDMVRERMCRYFAVAVAVAAEAWEVRRARPSSSESEFAPFPLLLPLLCSPERGRAASPTMSPSSSLSSSSSPTSASAASLAATTAGSSLARPGRKAFAHTILPA